jgi:type IV secretory pathway component VirB8
MQERDEDLAWAYGRIDRLEKQRLQMIIVFVVIAALLIVVLMAVVKFKPRRA